MAPPPVTLLPHMFADRLIDNVGDWVTAAVSAYAAVHGVYLGLRRWIRRRERRHELEAARDEALRVLLDHARETLHPVDGDVLDITARVSRRRTLLDNARDRLWLAHGRERSAPSSAQEQDSEDEDA